MLRTSLVAVAAGLALTLSLGSAPATASTAKYGHTAAPDRVLKPSCHNYGYRFRVKTPTNDWMLETFLVDPRGETIASGVLGAPAQSKKDRSHFRFCRNTTRPGKFKIRAKISWWDGDEKHTAWFKPSYFRLRKAS